MTKNYYEILEINTDATDLEIKSAFRKLARKWHPDVAGNSDDIVNKFKEINEAYEILSDPNKRKKYDTLRGILNNAKTTKKNESDNNDNKNTSNVNSTNNKSKETNTPEKNNKEKNNTKDNTTDNKNSFQDAWDNFIKKTTKSSSKQNNHKLKKINGTDITSDIFITVSEALLGTTRSINIIHTEPCPKCYGRQFANGTVCKQCNGSGEISVHKKISVKIPENIKQNAKIRISGEGNIGYNGGKNGDLYLIVKIDEKQSDYTYDGLNILQTVPVEPYEAVLGGNIKINTPNGPITMKLSSGTMNGQKYRLSNHGLTKDDKTGDMIVTIKIEIPKNLSKEEVILYKKLQEAANNRNIREILNEQ